jgi:hypothetical protein
MMLRIARALAAPLALSIVLASAAGASADLGAPTLVSVSDREQADSAITPVMSGDGRYVAFRATLGGVSGVYRKDLSNGAVDFVAGAAAYLTGAAAATSGNDAAEPSISADGRFVSFTTAAPLDATDDTNMASDVYVRDLGVPAASAGAYTLVSALDGSASGLSYPAGTSVGSVASGRVAMSADGRRVAFVVTAQSDLTSGPTGATPGVPTPGGQIAVRDLDTRTTTLVSTARDRTSGATTALPVPGGAVWATATSPSGGTRQDGAAISADGSTVAWLGAHIVDQAPTLVDEAAFIDEGDAAGVSTDRSYIEPLWRRIVDGAAAPTRRMVGGGDPLAPGCPSGGTLQTPACQGPFADLWSDVRPDAQETTGWLNRPGSVDGVPQLSADGRLAAVIGNPTPQEASNVYLIDLHDGLTRRQAVSQLTSDPPILDRSSPATADSSLHGMIVDFALSSNAAEVALTTLRTQFPVAPPYPLGAMSGSAGLTEVYRVDLATQLLQRVTAPADGGPSAVFSRPVNGTDGAWSPSFSADGRTVALSSTAANLVAGDANGAADVFVATDTVTPRTPGEWSISPAPTPAPLVPEWRLAVRSLPRADGSVTVDIVAPGGGTARVTASARVPVTKTVKVKAHVRRGGRTVTVTRTEHHTSLVTRQVARADKTTRDGGLVSVPLRLSSRYRTLAQAKAALRATLAVSFASPGHAALKDTLAASFHVKPLQARATPTTDGGLRLTIVAPGAGHATVTVTRPGASGHGRTRIATARGVAGEDGKTTISLRPGAAYRALVRRKAGLHVTAAITFSGMGGTQRTTVAATFHATQQGSR